MKRQIVRRSELHERVWHEPMTKLAPSLGLSDVGLRKVCVRNDIPVPPRGYWQRVAQGAVPKPPPLPKPGKDWDLEFHPPAQPPADVADQIDDFYGPLIEAEARPGSSITVPPELDAPHAMTRVVRKVLQTAKPDPFGGLVCEVPDAFRVRVPRSSVERALLIVDTIAKAVSARGFAIQPGSGGRYGFGGVAIGEAVLRLSLEETSSRQTHRATEAEKAQIRVRGYSNAPLYDFKPSGLMTLKIEGAWRAGFQTTWRDTPSRRLEERLNEVMIGLYRAARESVAQRRRNEVRQRRVDEVNARRAALRAEREAEILFFKDLEEAANAWRRAEGLRAYIGAVVAKLEGGGELPLGMNAAWLKRARIHADRIDPLGASPTSPLDYDDRDLRPISVWELAED